MPRQLGNSSHPTQWKETNLYASENCWSPDGSPFSFIHRVKHLLDARKYEESALFAARTPSLAHCMKELPMQQAYEGIPRSLVFISAIYSKVSLASDSLIQELQPELFLHYVIKWLSSDPKPAAHKDASVVPFVPALRGILRIIVRASPLLPQKLRQKKQRLEKCLFQLGLHGMVNSDVKMVNLQDAVRSELKKRLHQFKGALQKLEELSICHKNALRRTPSDGSHQRLLQVTTC
jgi:hypothetical protein